MADLSDDMTDEDVSSVKFLFGNRLPRERMEKAKVRQKFLLFFLLNMKEKKKKQFGSYVGF